MTPSDLYNLLDNPEPYSDRGMGGKQCISFTVKPSRMWRKIADLVEDCDNNTQAAEVVRGIETDADGLDVVIYWPRMAWPEECEK